MQCRWLRWPRWPRLRRGGYASETASGKLAFDRTPRAERKRGEGMEKKDEDELVFTVSGTVRLEPGDKVDPEHRLLMCAKCGDSVQRVSNSIDFENSTKTW